MRRLHIPILNTEEVVSFDLDHLPDESDEVIEVLKAEEAPVGIWMDLALAYLSQGSPEQYVHILQEACSKEADEFYGEKFRAERVEVLCCLAGYHLCKAQHLRDPSRKAELALAESYGIRARNLDKREMLSFLCLGMVAMARGDLITAKREFEVSVGKKNRGKTNVMPYIGLASVHFQDGKYNEALAYYKHILQMLGSHRCPPDIRNGMAGCYFRLGKFDFAKRAFLRTLKLHPHNPEALRGLAILILRTDESGDDKVLEEARDLLVRAYNTDPYDPATVVIICHILLLKGLYEKATDLAKVACDTAIQDNIKAEALTLLARSWHAREHFADACRFYTHAQKLNSTLPLPHLGLAQYYVSKNEIRNAVTELEYMLRGMPGSVDALKLLCRLYPHLLIKSTEKLQTIQDAGRRQHTDAHVWAVLGELMGPLDAKGSLDAYKKALEAFEKSDEAPGRKNVPVKVLNDAAVMFSRAGEYGEALKLIREALSRLEAGDLKEGPYPRHTLQYNLGRISEASGDVKGASAIFKEILADQPKYLDAYIRLAYICQHQGNTFEALEWCKKALEISPGDPTMTVVIAGLNILDNRWHEAKNYLDSIVKGPCSNDPYALLCMGTLNISSAPAERRQRRDKETATTHYLKALEYYQRAIDNCKQNIYAANGIGAALAEMGDLSTAREIFVQVQEAAASQGKYLEIPSIWVNLANIHLAFENYDSAIQVYENALARFYKHSDPALLVYLARAHYDKGNLADAKAALLKAQHLAPGDFTLRFNLALVMQEHAVRTLDKKPLGDDAQSVEECRKAGEDIARALRFFSGLRKAGSETTGIDIKKLASHIQFCSDELRRSKDVREEVEVRYQHAEAMRRKSRLAREEAERRHREEEELKQRKKEQEEAWKAEVVRKQMAKLERLKQSWKEEAELKKAAKKGDSSKIGRKRKMKADSDGFIVHGDEEERIGREVRRKKKSKDGGRYPASSPHTEVDHEGQAMNLDDDDDELENYSKGAVGATGLASDGSADDGLDGAGQTTDQWKGGDTNEEFLGLEDSAEGAPRDDVKIPDT